MTLLASIQHYYVTAPSRVPPMGPAGFLPPPKRIHSATIAVGSLALFVLLGLAHGGNAHASPNSLDLGGEVRSATLTPGALEPNSAMSAPNAPTGLTVKVSTTDDN